MANSPKGHQVRHVSLVALHPLLQRGIFAAQAVDLLLQLAFLTCNVRAVDHTQRMKRFPNVSARLCGALQSVP